MRVLYSHEGYESMEYSENFGFPCYPSNELRCSSTYNFSQSVWTIFERDVWISRMHGKKKNIKKKNVLIYFYLFIFFHRSSEIQTKSKYISIGERNPYCMEEKKKPLNTDWSLKDTRLDIMKFFFLFQYFLRKQTNVNVNEKEQEMKECWQTWVTVCFLMGLHHKSITTHSLLSLKNGEIFNFSLWDYAK